MFRPRTEDELYEEREGKRYPAPEPDWVEFKPVAPFSENEPWETAYWLMWDDGDDNARFHDGGYAA